LFYTVYKITNTINNKYYIGKHQTKVLDDGYMGSGKLIKRAIAKHGLANFTKEILHVFDNEEAMNAKEAELVVVSENTYNLCAGGHGGFGYINQHIVTRKIRKERGLKSGAIHAKKCASDQKLKKIISKNLHSSSSNLKRSLVMLRYFETHSGSFLGKNHTQDTKSKISHAMKMKQTGSKNSQFDTCWISNHIETKKIKKVDLDTWLVLGYKKGRNKVV
jgi:hypothetical protein